MFVMFPAANKERIIIFPIEKRTPVKTPPAITTFHDTFASGNTLNNTENQIETIIIETRLLIRTLKKLAVYAGISPVY